jgi:hypothetical protein
VTEARRHNGQTTARYQPARGKRSTDDPTPAEQVLYDLEQLAIEQTSAGSHGWADRTRDIARRLT